MEKTLSNSFAEKFNNFANKLGYSIEVTMQVLCLIAACIVLLPLAILYWVLIFNPISFWVWAMIHPKSAANSLRDRGTKELMAPVHNLLWNLNRKFRRFLPWRSRKEFFLATELVEATSDEQVVFFRKESQLAEKILKNDWLKKRAKAILFIEIAEPLRELLLPTMGSLTTEQFSFLVNNGEWYLAWQYMRTHTLSEQMLGCLIKAAQKHEGGGEDKALRTLCYYAQSHGLPARLINSLYKGKQKALLAEVEIALESFRQRSMVKQYASDREKWNRFLDDLGETELFVENQKLLTASQYRSYYLKGKKLSEGAIIFFLSQDNLEMAKLILSYEVKNNNLISNNIKSLIAAKPELARILLEA